MNASVSFLHFTDIHLAAGATLDGDDHKIDLPNLSKDTKADALDRTFQRVAECLASQNVVLSGILFTGDAQHRGAADGPDFVIKCLLKYFGPFGVVHDKIVAIPGNHDVTKGAEPGSQSRYDVFLKSWRASGCVTPWLDGIDKNPPSGGKHVLVAPDHSWAVVAVNSANWSQTAAVLPAELSVVWGNLPKMAGRGDSDLETKLSDQLEQLRRHDPARVSPEQLEVLRSEVANLPSPTSGPQIRIALLHHQLVPTSVREEIKTFDALTNVGQVRRFLLEQQIDVVIHGHKHEEEAFFETISGADGTGERRILVISGGTFNESGGENAVRLITLTGAPGAPSVEIRRMRLARGGLNVTFADPVRRRLWGGHSPVIGVPAIIYGTNIDYVYAQVVEAASAAPGGMLIAHLDMPDEQDGAPLPYPMLAPASVDTSRRDAWVKDLVDWWQREKSGLDHRVKYVHGARLRRYRGGLDQIKRIERLLETETTTRAIAIVVDPEEDLGEKADRDRVEFSSFALAQFSRRNISRNEAAIDIVAYYRAQEFKYWWPINVAELRSLQRGVAKAVAAKPGRITTIAADARIGAPAPTQVVVPAIDRWIDQAQEKLFVLASALSGVSIGNDKLSDGVVREWEEYLKDQLLVASSWNPDGIPVAKEGLERLICYLEATGDIANGKLELVEALKHLKLLNSQWLKSPKKHSDFKSWSASAKMHIEKIMRLSAQLLVRPEAG